MKVKEVIRLVAELNRMSQLACDEATWEPPTLTDGEWDIDVIADQAADYARSAASAANKLVRLIG